ncbi:unnamed protein product [Caenorhabditis sp. 36 PRJEB53466]|nr:unnamed protein product [Caenorhabditis sp. 36 PRJEB53466]
MSLFNSLYCSPCGKLYDEDVRRPCVGTCLHSICCQCQRLLHPKNCPICQEANAFAERIVNIQSIGVLQTIREQLTEENYSKFSRDLEFLDCGGCSECSADAKKLRICATCATDSGILISMRDEQGDRNWRLNSPSELSEQQFLCAKRRAICADCVLDGAHREHDIIMLRTIENVSEFMELKYLLGLGLLLRLKLDEEPEKCEYLASTVNFYRRVAHEFDLWSKLRSKVVPNRDVSFSFVSDTIQWKDNAKNPSEKIKQVQKRNDQLREVMLKCHRANFEEYFQFAIGYEQKVVNSDSEEKEKWKKTLHEMRVVREKLAERSVCELEPSKFEAIEKEIEKKMLELENGQKRESHLEVEKDSKFFKYRALIQELKEAEQEVKDTEQKVLMESKRNHEKVLKEEKEDAEPTRRNITHLEQLERYLRVEELIAKRLEASHRQLQAQLMKLKYFRKVPGIGYEDDIYIDLIDEVDVQEDFSFDIIK